MQVIIRTDSSKLIGSGHVMRCLVLAVRLKAEGYKVIFLCRDLPGNCSDIILQRGHVCQLLPFSYLQKEDYANHDACDDYAIWLGVDPIQDAKETLNYLNPKTKLLIIDHYALDIAWENAVKPFVERIMVIDDLANRQHNCDILLDHNYYINSYDRYKNLVPDTCKLLLGPQHALIDPALKAVKIQRYEAEKNHLHAIENILVFLGGMDLKNNTRIVLEQLYDTPLAHCHINVVLGKHNPHNSDLIRDFSSAKNLHFHIQPDYYQQLMSTADLSINAGGVSALERLYIGLPSILICTAENQRKICEDLSQNNLALFAIDLIHFKSLILKLYNNEIQLNLSETLKPEPDLLSIRDIIT